MTARVINSKFIQYLSECCDALPIGELDRGALGFCGKCKDGAVFHILFPRYTSLHIQQVIKDSLKWAPRKSKV